MNMLPHDLTGLLRWVLSIVWGELGVCREEAVEIRAIVLAELGSGPCCFMSSVGMGLLVPELRYLLVGHV